MRKIKFRAWDKYDGGYRTWEQLISIRYNENWFKDNEGKEYINFLFTDDTFILEQYTGVDDCTGREIYEGDIVQLDYDEVGGEIPHQFRGQVIWRESAFWVDSGSDAYPVFQEIATWEIYGNIHEDPV